MTIDRRALLLNTAATGAVAMVPIPAAARQHDPVGALPMPEPGDALPPPLLVQDPGRILLDRGWLFHDGDIVPPPPVGHDATYRSVKAGNAQGAAAIAYDDSDWPAVTLPHDWASFQPFVETANLSQGFRPRGIGWYRRTLRLAPEDRGKSIELQFGGIATNATIWVNGSVVAHNWSGYNSLYVDMTPFARFGDQLNVIAVRVDATVMEGWWYEGAGLYRHVWLARRAAVSIATDGVHCDPRKTVDGWIVPVTATLQSIAEIAASVAIDATLIDPAGRIVATAAAAPVEVPSLDQRESAVSLRIADPALWSIDTPTLYQIRIVLRRDGQVVDERIVPIGFRTTRFDPDRGFFLNDRPVKIKGVCIHQDHAGVGTALPDALIAWRLSRLKEMGCNAIRSSHNAPAPELLDQCDRLGILVMDENRLFNPSPDYMAQLRWLVRRDRNHPSVILWSVFNEEPMQGTEAGVQMVRRMAAAVHALDDSRPVTAAMNGSFFDPANVSQVVDVTGFNYYPGDYDRFHRDNPTKRLTSSEDTSAFMTRGAFASDPARHVISSYDTEAASWGATHRAGWAEIAKRPFVAGGFVWTGFDYHGEPTPYGWPTIASFFGAMDLCGFAKTAFDIHRAHWIDDAPVVSIAPHWTWPGRDGQPIKLLVMSNAERIVLRLNGRIVGEAPVDRLMGNELQIPYAPGLIEAIAYQGNREVARAVHETAGAPVALRLTPARRVMAGDGEDAQPVTIDAIDARGRHVPVANLMTQFSAEGGTIIGVGNGDPNCHEPEKGGQRSLFNGLAQIIVQANEGRGAIVLHATATGLRPATLRIDRLAVPPRGQAAVVAPAVDIAEWRRSPPFADKPAPGLMPADNDMNSWAFVRAGTPTPPEPATHWWLYRATILPSRSTRAKGGLLRFEGIAGRAELSVDGRRLAVKTDGATGPLDAHLPPGAAPLSVALIVEAEAGAPSGLIGRVALVGQ